MPIPNVKRRILLRAILPVFAVAVQGTRGKAADSGRVRIVTLGDSITKGVRPGVSDRQTFAALIRSTAESKGKTVEVVNVGIGGERTDQALKRLDRDVLTHSPAIVTVMYGANDSYVDPGKKEPRLSQNQFRKNLDEIVDRLQSRDVKVVLMTEPRWGAAARPNGLGEHPNLRLEGFMEEVRSCAQAKGTALVDHFSIWTEREKGGLDLGTITTDQLHPNPEGHRILADSIWPVLEPIIQEAVSSKP